MFRPSYCRKHFLFTMLCMEVKICRKTEITKLDLLTMRFKLHWSRSEYPPVNADLKVTKTKGIHVPLKLKIGHELIRCSTCTIKPLMKNLLYWFVIQTDINFELIYFGKYSFFLSVVAFMKFYAFCLWSYVHVHCTCIRSEPHTGIIITM